MSTWRGNISRLRSFFLGVFYDSRLESTLFYWKWLQNIRRADFLNNKLMFYIEDVNVESKLRL